MEVARTVPLAETAAEHVLNGFLERFSKLAVEVRVDDRVERRVEVADPEEKVDDDAGKAGTGFAAHVNHDVDAEEGQPADEEGAHDDACVR